MSLRQHSTLILVLVFLLGIGCGVGASLLLYPRVFPHHRPDPAKMRADYLARVTKELSLTPQQTQQFGAVLDDSFQRWRQVQEQTRAEMLLIRQQERSKARALLNDQQKVKFDQLMARFDQEMRKHHPPPR